MAYLRGWRVSCLRHSEDGVKRPFSVVLEHRDKQEALHFESGAITELLHNDYALIRDRFARIEDVFGCLGVYKSSTYDPVLKAYPSFLVIVTECKLIGKLPLYEVYRINSVRFLCLDKDNYEDESCNEIRKLISSGAFYFAKQLSTGMPYDVTRNTQSYFQHAEGLENFPTNEFSDQRFLWNRGLLTPFYQQGITTANWIYPVICGGFGVSTLYAGLKRAQICVVSRLSTLRPGTRFNVRGVDDNGYVANFVETEVLIYVDNQVLSHVQIRGTVPLFWEQPGLQVGSHKIKILRFHETSLKAFNRHFAEILSRYGETIIVNLMGSKESEDKLSKFYHELWNISEYQSKIGYVAFDYHAVVGSEGVEGVKSLLSRLEYRLSVWGYFHFDGTQVKRRQTGVVRTNCVDCLDRTNALQTMISIMLLRAQFLNALDLLSGTNQYTDRHAQEILQSLWIENGDNVSRIYTGTGALGGDRSRFKNVQRSATRTIKNNFFDGAKQEAMVALVNTCSLVGWQRLVAGQFLPRRLHFLPQSVLQSILDRNADFTRRERLKIFVGTWNVNGGRNTRSLAHMDNDLSDWLFQGQHSWGFRNPNAPPEAFARPTDIFVVGFEEIIDLNASNVVAGRQRSDNQEHWGETLQGMLDVASVTGEPYVLLCTTQMVGVCIFLFVRLGLCEHVRSLFSASIKTGMHGKAGNKGAVAVRFQIGATTLCFCCAHLTAGQSAVRERNAEVSDINQRLLLPPDKRSVPSHDYVFWFGDLNYRIDLPNAEVKNLISKSSWCDLLRSDQLSVHREAKAVFEGFLEGPVRFAPTYKYDLFCDDYDTSEKARCPAWTDRILWRRANLTFKKSSNSARSNEDSEKIALSNLLVYHRTEIKTSDHRPVSAVFDVDIQIVEPEKRRQVVEGELLAAGPGDATVRVRWTSENANAPVSADDIYQSIVELASSAGTIVLTRFHGVDQLMLTFSTPYEAVEAVRCLNGNKVSIETARQQVVLSVCFNSAPSLPVARGGLGCDGLQSFSTALNRFSTDEKTRDWLTQMNSLVAGAEDEYLRTHGPPPDSEVFKPTVSLAHLRLKENVVADEQRRRQRVTILANEDQALIDLWDGEEKPNATAQPAPHACVPPRPPPPSSGSQLPDASILSQLLHPGAALHSAQSCNDLFSDFCDTETKSQNRVPKQPTPTLPGALGSPILRHASARDSPQHPQVTIPTPPPPKRLPPRPPPQPPANSSAAFQPLIDLTTDLPVVSHKMEARGGVPDHPKVMPPPTITPRPPLTPERVAPPIPVRPKHLDNTAPRPEAK
uniref:phosphoinositide 5-phosphatase n=1 Tax=Mesocestoides corti TaxID=53468 RepID=A0A5K3ESZ3_MESCO